MVKDLDTCGRSFCSKTCCYARTPGQEAQPDEGSAIVRCYSKWLLRQVGPYGSKYPTTIWVPIYLPKTCTIITITQNLSTELLGTWTLKELEVAHGGLLV